MERADHAELAVGVEQLRLKFPGAERLTFRDLSFSVRHGERVLLLGPSGCGKSTLLQVLTGLIPQAIDVPIAADWLKTADRPGVVFQDPDTQFCMPYVDEELAFVLENRRIPRERMKEQIERLLASVGLTLDDAHTPINALSQGMKQRLAVATALALEPDILFLDEPTALLDPQGTKQVWDTIRRVGEGKTIVIVEHKIELIVDDIDRVVLFDRSGAITADGPPRIVFAEHKSRLAEDGIWYPGVWDEAFAPRGRTALAPAAQAEDPRLALQSFAVYRGKQPKLSVDAATVAAGDWVAVAGPNGAGKSTLLLGLMQLLKTTGEYDVNGVPARHHRVRQMAEEIAFVFQNPEFQFVTNSVYDEVAFTLRRDRMPEADIAPKVQQLLAEFGLSEHSGQHPFQLSLGQKRRLSVASAIVKEQRILLLDEPTFGQDARNTFALLDRLEAMRRSGTAIVMVTHDPDIVRRFATRVWVVQGGRLQDELTPLQWSEAMQADDPDGDSENAEEAGRAAKGEEAAEGAGLSCK
ncbi:MAG: transporter [Paenibacillus sp.]|nr:transporter [Paenibacillus sp.]